MLFSSDLKRHVCVAAKCKTAADIRGVLALVEQHGREIRNRTHLKPEVARGEYRKPIEVLPPGETRLVLEEVGSLEGPLPAKFVGRMSADFVEAVLNLPLVWRVFFDVKLSIKKMPLRNLRLLLAMLEGKWFLGFQFYSHPKELPEAQACFDRLIKLANLPMEIGVAGAQFVLRHTAVGGEVLVDPNTHGPYLEKEADGLGGFGASFPQASTHEIVSRFRSVATAAEVKPRDGEWLLLLGSRPGEKQDTAETCEALNKLDVPGEKVACDFCWHLADYHDFEQMPIMTRYLDEPVAQSLLDFEFGEGRRCQLDIMCQTRDKYRLLLSFDEREAAQELASLFKMKLNLRED